MTLLIHRCPLRPIYCMADSEESRGDEVAEKDAAGDDEGVQPGERSVVVQMVLVVPSAPYSRTVGHDAQSSGVAWRGRSGTLELATSRGGWHSFQMQGLRFRVTNDRHHIDLQYVGLFPDGKLPLDYI